MIMDSIGNAAIYRSVSPGIRAALEFLARKDLAALEIGRHDIDGDKVYALVQQYETRPREKGKWEAHRRYIDVQYVAAGIETMGYAPLDKLTVTQPYAEEKDCLLLSGEGSFLTVPEKTFVVFFPQDAHMPCLAFAAPVPVRKVVVKVAVGA
jgi:biofilm protein TabA